MATLASLIVDFEARTANFERQTVAMRKSMDRIRQQTDNVAKGFAIAAKAAGAFFAIKAVANQAKSLIDYGDSLSKANAKLGISTESLSRFAHVAELADVDLQGFTQSLQKQLKYISEAAEKGGTAASALNNLGLSAKKLKELTPEQQFEAISYQLQKVKNDSDKVRIAMDIWGKSGSENLKIINQGTEAIQAQMREAEQLGLVISGKTAKEMEGLNDAITKLKGAAKGLGIAFISEFVSPTIKALQLLASTIDDVARGIRGVYKTATGDQSVNGAANVLNSILEDQKKIIDDIRKGLMDIDSGTFTELASPGAEELNKQLRIATENVSVLRQAINSMPSDEFDSSINDVNAFGAAAKGMQDILDDINGAGKSAAQGIDAFSASARKASETSPIPKKIDTQNGGAIPEYLLKLDMGLNAPYPKIPDYAPELTKAEKQALRFRDAMIDVDNVLTDTAITVSDQLAVGITDLALGTAQFGDVVRSVAVTAVQQLIQSIVQLGVQRLVMSALFTSAQAAETTATAASMATVATAAAPAAAGVSIASFGAAAAAGIAGLVAGYAIAKNLGKAHAGLTNAPEEATYIVRRNERILAPEQNRDLTDYLASQDTHNVRNGGDIYNIAVTPQVNAIDSQTGAEFFVRHRSLIGALVAEEVRRSLRK